VPTVTERIEDAEQFAGNDAASHADFLMASGTIADFQIVPLREEKRFRADVDNDRLGMTDAQRMAD
jgi:hypothetical protein